MLRVSPLADNIVKNPWKYPHIRGVVTQGYACVCMHAKKCQHCCACTCVCVCMCVGAC